MSRPVSPAVTERVYAALDPAIAFTARQVATRAGIRRPHVYRHLQLLIKTGRAVPVVAFGQHDKYRRVVA